MAPVEIACGAETRFQLTAAALAALDPAPAGRDHRQPGQSDRHDHRRRRAGAPSRRSAARAASASSPTRSTTASATGSRRARCWSSSPTRWSSTASPNTSAWPAGGSAGCWRPSRRCGRARACVGNLFLTAPSLSQHAGAGGDGLPRRARRPCRSLSRATAPCCWRRCRRSGLAGIAPPDGAFYIYADIGHLTDDSLAFCERLLRDTGVATAPGRRLRSGRRPPFHPLQLRRLDARGRGGAGADEAVVRGAGPRSACYAPPA